MILSLTEDYRRIRRIRHEDVAALMAWDNDPDLFELTGKKFQHGEDYGNWWSELVHDRARIMFGIVNDGGALIGDVELIQIVWRAREAEIRISIGDKAFWNRGYGTQALGEAIAAAFHFLSLERLYLRVRVDNIRAIRSYEKVGFRPVARLAATGRLHGYTDLNLMEVTRVDFLAQVPPSFHRRYGL